MSYSFSSNLSEGYKQEAIDAINCAHAGRSLTDRMNDMHRSHCATCPTPAERARQEELASIEARVRKEMSHPPQPIVLAGGGTCAERLEFHKKALEQSFSLDGFIKKAYEKYTPSLCALNLPGHQENYIKEIILPSAQREYDRYLENLKIEEAIRAKITAENEAAAKKKEAAAKKNEAAAENEAAAKKNEAARMVRNAATEKKSKAIREEVERLQAKDEAARIYAKMTLKKEEDDFFMGY